MGKTIVMSVKSGLDPYYTEKTIKWAAKSDKNTFDKPSPSYAIKLSLNQSQRPQKVGRVAERNDDAIRGVLVPFPCVHTHAAHACAMSEQSEQGDPCAG